MNKLTGGLAIDVVFSVAGKDQMAAGSRLGKEQLSVAHLAVGGL